MPLTTGTRLGPYEVLTAIGAGGMGEVYKAKDTRLDRVVAVKVLPASLAGDKEFRERFEREAKSISALSHPNICTLHDVGNERPRLARGASPRDAERDASGGGVPASTGKEDDAVQFLVMEFLEGETLADRIAKGPLPLAEALKTATEIASALDKAHRHGIVHRDLKPGNVMLTKTGAKLLDFGLAKVAAAGAVSGGAMTALATSPLPSAKNPALTAQGAILGTFQYMAPEQIEGIEADARSDIFAFGAVLYEMITGKRAFTGRSQASLMSAIMKDEPAPVSQALPVAPPALDQILRHCLAKDPDDRFQTAHDLLLQLRWVAEGSGAAAPAPAVAPGRRPMPGALLAIAGLVIAALGVAAGFFVRPQPEVRITRFAVSAPPKAAFGEALAMSPDGKRLAFLASADGANMVWIRTLDVVAAQPMPGTEGANVGVFWSPDSAHIGFFADGKLKRAPVGGGPVQKICDATLPSGGTWGKDDVVVFAAGANEGLSRVAAAGGTATVITTVDASKKENSHRWPAFLPDGRHFLYLARNINLDNSVVYAASVDDPTHPTHVLVTPSSALFAPPGYLLFVRERSLMAQAFDPGALRTTGDAFPVAENVGASTTRVMLGAFSVSDAGVLAYGTGTSPNRQYAWFDRAGKELSRIAPVGQFTDLALAPDGTRAAVREDVAGNADIWILDLIRGVPSRLTFDTAVDWFPVWSADGSRVIFYSTRSAAGDIYQKPASGTSADELLLSTGLGKLPSDASRDGRFLMYSEVNPKTKNDLWVLPLSGDKKPVPYIVTPFNDNDGHFSPDGKWVAYMSDETGKPEVYIQSFPASGGKAQISNGGGGWPRWRGDGKELFYLAPDRKLIAAPIKAGALDGVPAALFETQVDSYTAQNRYAPAADGQRFLVNVPNGAPVSTPLTVVLNWTAALKK